MGSAAPVVTKAAPVIVKGAALAVAGSVAVKTIDHMNKVYHNTKQHLPLYH